jgi:hypothetical protein
MKVRQTYYITNKLFKMQIIYLLLLMQIFYLVLIFNVSYLLFFGSSAQLRLILINRKGILHFRMKRTKSVRVVQHSRTLLKGWRANCDIKLLLYSLIPHSPGISEIEDVSRYVVSYMGKRHNTSQAEIDAIQNIIMK